VVFKNNVEATYHVLEECVRANVKRYRIQSKPSMVWPLLIIHRAEQIHLRLDQPHAKWVHVCRSLQARYLRLTMGPAT
jgi:hypothetical protein